MYTTEATEQLCFYIQYVPNIRVSYKGVTTRDIAGRPARGLEKLKSSDFRGPSITSGIVLIVISLNCAFSYPKCYSSN